MTLEESLQAMLADAIGAIHISMPGRVESYNAADGSVNVQPLIRNRFETAEGDMVQQTLPVIVGVPVLFPGLGANSLTFPINRGDLVLLLFTHKSLASWLRRGGTIDDTGELGSTLDDAVALPGLYSLNAPISAHKTATVLVAADIRLGGSDAADPVVRQSDLAQVVSSLNALITAFTTHYGLPTHGTPTPVSPATVPTCSTTVRSK